MVFPRIQDFFNFLIQKLIILKEWKRKTKPSSQDAEKSFDKKSTPINDKTCSKAEIKGELLQSDKKQI